MLCLLPPGGTPARTQPHPMSASACPRGRQVEEPSRPAEEPCCSGVPLCVALRVVPRGCAGRVAVFGIGVADGYHG